MDVHLKETSEYPLAVFHRSDVLANFSAIAGVGSLYDQNL